jgi:hypothetical protein
VIVRETNDVAVAVPAPMSSRIRGGPVLGGAVVALATWVFLELLLFASGLSGLTTNVGTSSNASSWWWSAAAALVAFFIGGLVCGASTPWRHFSDGVISGLVVWAVLVVGLIVFSGLGVGIGFGAFGSVLSVGRDAVAGTPITSSAVSSAQDAAWVAAIALAATLIACVLGGAIGSKTWPGKRQTTQLQSIDMH